MNFKKSSLLFIIWIRANPGNIMTKFVSGHLFVWKISILPLYPIFWIPRHPLIPSLQWRHMSVMASQTTGNWTVCSTIYTDCISNPGITGLLWGESTGYRWIPLTNGQCGRRFHVMTLYNDGTVGQLWHCAFTWNVVWNRIWSLQHDFSLGIQHGNNSRCETIGSKLGPCRMPIEVSCFSVMFWLIMA